jgi:hypothetical protein
MFSNLCYALVRRIRENPQFAKAPPAEVRAFIPAP